MKLVSQFKHSLLFKTNLESICKNLYNLNVKKWEILKKVITFKKKKGV